MKNLDLFGSEVEVPDPAGVACWEQWLKWREKRKG